MRVFRSVLLCVMLCGAPVRVFAEAPEANDNAASFQCVRKVFDELTGLKAEDNVLNELSEDHLKVDNLGFPYIEYSRDLSDGRKFYLLLRAMTEKASDNHSQMDGYREFVDPFLGLKFVVYVSDIPALGTINPYEMMQKAADSFYSENSHNEALMLSLTPSKPNYAEGEKVELDLVLKNVGPVGLLLKKLTDTSVRCYFNQRLWDEKGAGAAETVTLKPGEELRRKIWVPVQNKGTLKVFCTYLPKVMGGQPSANTTVNID